MQAQLAEAKEKSIDQKSYKALIVSAETLFDRMQEIHQHIANRAFQLYEERGYEFGHDLEHWLNAEAELLVPVPIDLTESATHLEIRAWVPDFKQEELQINVQPQQLTLSGKSETRTESNGEKVEEVEVKQLFYSVPLPCEVKPEDCKVVLKDGSLEITLLKVTPDKEKA